MARIILTGPNGGQYIWWHLRPRQDTTKFLSYQCVKSTVGRLRRYKIVRRLASFVPWSYLCRFPPAVLLELTNRCDLKCVMCHRGFMTRDVGDMDWARVVRITEEMGREHGTMLVLIGQGEPTLYPRFLDSVAQAKKTGIDRVLAITNGQHLAEIADELVATGLDDLHVSIDGFRKEILESIRIGSNMDTTISGIRSVLRARERAGSKKPTVALRYCCMPKNIGDREQFIEFWQDILGENDEIRFDDLQRYKEGPISGEAAEYPCENLWRRLYIRWNGDYAFCQNHRDNRLGIYLNHDDLSLKELWRHEKLEHVRAIHMRGRKKEIKACSVCPLMSKNAVTKNRGTNPSL